jgi:Holliday junction DNA helicase RuvA
VYEFLEGKVVGRSATRVVLQVGGVAYDLAAPLTADFRRAGGGTTRVYTHLVVREDAHLLFGFPDRDTREVFRLLLSVRGVGPSTALAVLSGLPLDTLLEAIVRGDAATLTRIKGVGKKTAEQILLDLRDRALSLTGSEPGARMDAATASPEERARLDNVEDAVHALVSIGFSEKEARKSVDRAASKVDAGEIEDLVRAALTAR